MSQMKQPARAGAKVLQPLPSELQRLLQASLAQLPLRPAPVWEEVLPQASRHQLDSFIFNRMAAAERGKTLPEELWQEWVRRQQWCTVEAMRLQEQLRQLLAALRQAGVEVVPLKGSWLAEHVYDDIAERQMNDIDLLVKGEAVKAAAGAIEALGYRFKAPATPDSWSKDVTARHPAWRRGVELHWSISHPSHGLLPPQKMERIWSCTRPAQVAGVEVSVLAPATHLIYLTYHIMSHQWRVPLRSLLDLVMFGRRYASELSPAELQREAAAWGLGFRAAFAWQVAHDFCGVPTPAELAPWGALLNDSMAEREAVLQLLRPQRPARPSLSRLLGEFHQATLWRRLAILWQAWFIPELQLREQYAVAVKWGGLMGGYLARLFDLWLRRLDDLVPGRKRRRAVKEAAFDMNERLRLERWLELQESLQMQEE